MYLKQYLSHPVPKGQLKKCVSSTSCLARYFYTTVVSRHAVQKHFLSAITILIENICVINILHLKTFASSYPEHKHFSERHLCDKNIFLAKFITSHNLLELLNFVSESLQHHQGRGREPKHPDKRSERVYHCQTGPKIWRIPSHLVELSFRVAPVICHKACWGRSKLHKR